MSIDNVIGDTPPNIGNDLATIRTLFLSSYTRIVGKICEDSHKKITSTLEIAKNGSTHLKQKQNGRSRAP